MKNMAEENKRVQKRLEETQEMAERQKATQDKEIQRVKNRLTK